MMDNGYDVRTAARSYYKVKTALKKTVFLLLFLILRSSLLGRYSRYISGERKKQMTRVVL